MNREEKLLKVIALLWDALPDTSRQQLHPIIKRTGAVWAIPEVADDTEWLTTIEVALEFQLSPSSIRTNWPRQYNIRPTNDRWLRADVELVRLKRRLKGHVA